MNKQYKTCIFSSEPLWNEVPECSLDCSNWDSKVHYDTRFKMCCVRSKGIYVLMSTNETDIRAVNRERDTSVWEDSCMEFFLQPFPHRSEYLNFEMNSIGAWLCQFGSEREGRVLLRTLTDKEIRLETQVTDDGWSLSLFIPDELISEAYGEVFTSQVGFFKGNFYKCGDLTSKPHYDSFAAMTTLPPGFHNPECFAELIISER